MKRFNKFRRLLGSAALAAAAAVAMLTGCTEVDDTLGSNLVPDNQQMKAGFRSLPGIKEQNPKKYVETRLFQTDSILASNISNGYLGSTLSDTLGLRTAGFLSQYISYYLVDSGYFGFRPIFDSAQLLLSVNGYGSDTLTRQLFEVYEVISNDYLYEKPVAAGKSQRDTAFYLTFDPENVDYLDGSGKRIISEKPLFTFELGGDRGPATTAVTMTPTEEGKKFVKRLMLHPEDYKEGDPIDYSFYSTDSLSFWVEKFKGLYIRPAAVQPELSAAAPGTVYSLSLAASGLSIYGRNRVKEDPSLIKDTIGMVYYFYDSYQNTYGNVSVNVVDHDYDRATSPAKIELSEAAEWVKVGDHYEKNLRPENPRAYVAGMGGVVTELTFTEQFFDELERIIEAENDASGKTFERMAFSQARMSVYFPASHYDWNEINPANPGRLIAEMNAAPTRLGLYTDYKKLTPVADYLYVYENSYDVTIAYGGYVNRSHGCYVMDVTSYIQELWNSYLSLKQQAGATYVSAEKDPAAHRVWAEKIDWTKIANRTVYLGPEAYDIFTPRTTVLQGAATEGGAAIENNAPIRFDLTYNLVK
ncbi:DUF4270 family protein [Alistipes sp.]|uniref:DUF4270 family protein n=1 Tax=Alistipes sp. TaxID=1872444 RepID=UPI003AF02570